MVSFGIQFVKSNQYSNNCFLFWLGLFSLAFDFLAYLQEWTLHKICPTVFLFFYTVGKLTKKKELCSEGEPPQDPQLCWVLYITFKRS